MRQIVEEAWKPYSAFSKTMPQRKALDLALGTTTWTELESYLTRKNRKTMLKGIWQGLQDRLSSP